MKSRVSNMIKEVGNISIVDFRKQQKDDLNLFLTTFYYCYYYGSQLIMMLK